MKIMVFSDSHRDVETMAEAVRAQRPEMIFHLGDHSRDAAALGGLFPEIPLFAVKGNTDWDNLFPEEQTLELFGRRLLLVHGHRQGVKTGAGRLFEYASGRGFDAAFFGHTHQPFEGRKNGVTLYNPGSAGRHPFRSAGSSCGIFEIDQTGFSWTLVRL